MRDAHEAALRFPPESFGRTRDDGGVLDDQRYRAVAATDALRALSDPDVLMTTDLVVRRRWSGATSAEDTPISDALGARTRAVHLWRAAIEERNDP
ncbi:hypothetical protein [uncultured Aeromicrobium sp.]|uniref:hypothetical protein n=1 Tax=uncultured Aeromicrobium sp. TaxID=337820 RepID=UPI0025FAAC0E|nr:hypothetical protein [uncultured Aeromicrobium sp.]